jgi:fucose 4-O-acetylase-like acetyltransferase
MENKTKQTQNQRIDFIDLLRGIVIILVVMFHLTYFFTGTAGLNKFINPYFMQLFFFVSGMFFTPKKSFKNFFVHKINRLIIPLLFFYFLNHILGFITSNLLGFSLIDKFNWTDVLNLFIGNENFLYGSAVWFLLCLFIVYVLYYLISLTKNNIVKFVFSIVCCLASLYLSYNQINVPYFFDSALSMIIFFFLGNVFYNKVYLPRKTKIQYNNTICYLLSIGILVLYILIVANFQIYIDVMHNKYTGNIFLITVSAFSGIVFFYILCKLIGKIEIVNFFGKNTLIILGTHQALINAISIVLSKGLHISGWLGLFLDLVLTMSIECVVILFLNKYFSYLVGKKALIKE